MGFEWSYHGLARAYAAGIHEYEAEQARQRSWPRHVDINGVTAIAFWGRTNAGVGLMVIARRLDQWNWQIVDVHKLTAAQDTELMQREEDADDH